MFPDNAGNADVAKSTLMSTGPCSRQDNHLSALQCGARLQSYTIGAILGEGGFGITYKAREDVTNREVAIKEYLPTSLAMRDADGTTVRPLSAGAARDFDWGLERFRHEARLLIEFRHPNIVPVLSYFEANGTGYLIMEFQEGSSLAEILRDTPTMSEAQVLQFMAPFLDSVEEVHRRNFLHRDIKPDNIFIRRDGAPVLLDFGAARRALGERSKKFTTVLTEGYAPFEQYADSGNQGPWSDVYALGAVMFECLAGKSPVEAPRRASAKLRGVPDPLAQDFAALRVGVSSDVAFAIEAALRVVDKERPQTVADFRELIVSTKPATVRMPAAQMPAAASPASPAGTLIPDMARRRDVVRYPPPWHRAGRRKPRRAARYMAFGAVVVFAAAGIASNLGDPVNWLAEGFHGARIESARSQPVSAQPASESERQAENARLQADEARRQAQVAEERRRAEDKDFEERRNQALVDHQQRQLERFEEERRQTLAAIRAAEMERQRAAEAERKRSLDTSGPTDPAPPPNARPPNHGAFPFRGLRPW